MDGAFSQSIDTSLMKAMTAASYGIPTGDIAAGIDLKLAIATQGKRINLPGGLPIIVDGHVIGVPDDHFGEELMAVVKLRDGAPQLTIGRLRAFCAGRIARFKIPRYLWIVDEFPMTVTGKVRKGEMRERAIEYLGDRD